MGFPGSPAVNSRVVVLLATRNGQRWLADQLETIMSQQGIDLRVVALDDESTDGTREWLVGQAAKDPRLEVMPSMGRSGSAVANFFRLILNVDVDDSDYIAFADQDDLWLPGKLARHVEILRATGAAGLSSNVTSFTPDGTRTLIRKSDPQRRFDYLLQSPGPGSTFLLTPRLFQLVRDVLKAHYELASQVDFHDSFIYVIARSRGWTWHIDPEPTVGYRQHDANVIGANVGMISAMARLTLIRSGWHRQQAIAMARVAVTVAPKPARRELEQVLGLLETNRLQARLRLVALASQFRRRPRDRVIIGFLIITGIW